jgi:glycerol-3-phosphate acyltransferase PlsX
MIIAVDAAGGDHYPQSPVEGAVQAIEENDNITVVLVGPEDIIENELANYEYDQQRLLVQHAPEIIGMDESPAQAVKTKQKSSIVSGIGMQKAGKCKPTDHCDYISHY